jgi:hypothetical protein
MSQRFPLGRIRSWLGVGAIALSIIAAVSSTASAAPGGCITTMPVKYAFPSAVAVAYHRTLPVSVTSKGPMIHNLTVGLYTFQGDQLAFGRARSQLTATQSVVMRLRFGFLNPGRYTLVIDGEPNANPSCGPKHLYQVVRFRPCASTLPITLSDLPHGLAAAYGDVVTVNADTDYVLRNVAATLTTFGGTIVDRRSERLMFGETTIKFTVSGGLAPGGYTITLTGRVPGQPGGCGLASTSAVMRFR